MKTLDCVSTCPNDALYFGKGPSAIKKQSRGGIMPDRRHDLSVRGEVALGVLFLASFLSYRGIYAAVPMLMAVGMALVTSWTLWKAWCVMRLANAKDEIVPLNDLRVQRNRAYLIIVLLSRVVTRLGDLNEVNTGVIENMFASDLRFLEEMYNRINEDEATVGVVCPECGAKFEREFGRLGES